MDRPHIANIPIQKEETAEEGENEVSGEITHRERRHDGSQTFPSLKITLVDN